MALDDAEPMTDDGAPLPEREDPLAVDEEDD